MKTAGIICEYNPFHNGHAYHIAETKKRLSADGVVCVMSGDVVQRGDSAVFPMKKRAEAAVMNGADLVLELPPRFVLQSAEFYAYNAVYILNSLGIVDFLSFGSECGDIERLSKAAKKADGSEIRKELKKGVGYASVLGREQILKSPNNILGVEYIKAIQALKSEIVPFTLPRKDAMHDSEGEKNGFASATYIRGLIDMGQDFSLLSPMEKKCERLKTAEELWNLISYRLKLGDKNNFENTANISEGLNNRLLSLGDCKSFSECVEKASCKRYTKARIRRALLSILFGFEKVSVPPTYTRVLALNQTGRKILKEAEEKSKIPILRVPSKKDFYNIPFLREEYTVKNILKADL